MPSYLRFVVAAFATTLASLASTGPVQAQGFVYSVTTSLGGGLNKLDRFSTVGPVNETNIVPTTQGITGASGLVFGPGGFLYLSDRDTSNIYRVNPAGGTGAVTLYANVATNTTGPAGMAFIGNDLYVSRFGSIVDPPGLGQVNRYDITGGAPVFSATVVSGQNQPTGIGVGPTGSLYISNVGYGTTFGPNGFYSGSVTRYNPTTGVIDSPFIATGSGGLLGPSASKIGPDGNLWVVDTAGQAIRRYNPTTGAYLNDFLTPAVAAQYLLFPSDIVFDDQNRVWVANLGFETQNIPGSIQRFNLDGSHFDTVANTGYYAQLAFQPVPEPTAVLGFASAGLFGLRRLRRMRKKA